MADAKLAREEIESWKPIGSAYCLRGNHLSHGAPEWRKSGQSAGCSFCGSMSTEEIEESLLNDAVQFDLSDRGHKVYVHRYHHPGECSEPWTSEDGRSSSSGCSCDVKRGGGPIKFYMWHLGDLAADEERKGLESRLRVRCADDMRRLQRELVEHREAVARGERKITEIPYRRAPGT